MLLVGCVESIPSSVTIDTTASSIMAGEEHMSAPNGIHPAVADHGAHHGNVAATVQAYERGSRVIIPAQKNSLTREDRKPKVPRQCRTCGGAYRQSCHVHAIRSFINAFCLSYGTHALTRH